MVHNQFVFPVHVLGSRDAMLSGSRLCFSTRGVEVTSEIGLAVPVSRALMLGCLGMLLGVNLLVVTATAPAAGQQVDLNAIQRRYNQSYAAGDYATALAEALKLEARAKARLGETHPDYGAALYNLGLVYGALRRYEQAEEAYKRALPIKEKAFGADDLKVANTLVGLGIAYWGQRKYADAEEIDKRALAIEERALGPNHAEVAIPLDNLAIVYLHQGKYSDAEGLSQRALAIREKALSPDSLELARNINTLANIYSEQGKYADAERLHRRALTTKEKAVGADKPTVAATLDNLAGVYKVQGRYAEAEGLSKRALAIYEKAQGKDSPDVADNLTNLANIYQNQGKYADAEQLHARSLAIAEKVFGADHHALAAPLNNLANVYHEQGKYTDAEQLYQRALAVGEKGLGPDSPTIADALNNLGETYRKQRKYSAAEELEKRALAVKQTALGADHPEVANTLNNLAGLYREVGKVAEALVYSRKATAAVIAHADTETSGAGHNEGAGGLIEQRANFFATHVANLATAARERLEPAASLGGEALVMAQWAKQSAAAAAVAQMGARFAAGTDALAALVREQQDLSAFRRDRDEALLRAMAKPQAERNRAAISALRSELASIESRLAANTARLEREFPEYAALVSARPLAAEQIQALLAPDEALLFWLPGEDESYVFALTRDGFDWHTIAIGAESLSTKVAAFRRGLDLEKLLTSRGKPELFDLVLAHELYLVLIGPVEPLVKDKRHLIVVPTGALTSLPFHLLLIETPAKPVLELKDIALYREASWLIKRQAVSVLPSVASLKTLRAFLRKADARKVMIAFADPVFDPAERARSLAERGTRKNRAVTQPYSEIWQGSSIDHKKLAQALPSLIDTANEVTAVAEGLGAPRADIHLQKDATETAVKRVDLADYRVVYFATHGLLAGEVKGLGEPALALTLPARPSDLDDGLLTASEVAQLKLNSDWVVLSACNTAAGDKPGAEALSGLARAFFYAGARALLVSHWAVDSDAATRLTTATFDILRKDPNLGRAEALRRAMLNDMNDPSDPLSAHPAIWAPFVVVGEGTAR
jgi:CHAT domain-containing protein/tetratricopeptide (TPR) repeat protein